MSKENDVDLGNKPRRYGITERLLLTSKPRESTDGDWRHVLGILSQPKASINDELARHTLAIDATGERRRRRKRKEPSSSISDYDGRACKKINIEGYPVGPSRADYASAWLKVHRVQSFKTAIVEVAGHLDRNYPEGFRQGSNRVWKEGRIKVVKYRLKTQIFNDNDDQMIILHPGDLLEFPDLAIPVESLVPQAELMVCFTRIEDEDQLSWTEILAGLEDEMRKRGWDGKL